MGRYRPVARRAVSGSEITAGVKLPKPTVHRTCAMLESMGMGMLQRQPDSKKLSVGPRLCSVSV